MKTRLSAIASLLLLFVCTTTNATTIEYTLSNLGGDSYRYNYVVVNDSLATDLDNFTIYFDLNLYENLSNGAAPVNWDPLVIQPDLGIPDDGFYDAFAFVSGIAAGDMLGGFSVEFDWLGAGLPGAQDFEVYDVDFNLVDSGSTVVPEPGTLALFGIGLLALRAKRFQNRKLA